MVQYDLIICIYACDTIPKYREQILKINETYGKMLTDNIKLVYFLGEEIELIGDNYIHLPGVKNDYRSSFYKQNLGLKYIHDNFDFKFVICCGSDTYLNIPKLMNFIKQFDSTQNYYIGGHGCNRMVLGNNYYFHSGGPGFILSKECLKNIYPYLYSMIGEWESINPELNYACDVAISYFLQIKVNRLEIVKNSNFHHCNHHGSPCCVGKVVFQNIISCHNMSPSDFDEMNSEILNS